VSFRVIRSDCIEAMGAMEEASVDAIVTDPPYGLEFMGKDWDRFSPDDPRLRSGWDRAAAPHGIAEEAGAGKSRVSFHTRRSTYRCTGCGKRDAFRNPHDCDGEWVHEWTDSRPLEALSFQAWCELWAREALRVLKPGGHLLAFGGSRTYHRLASAIEDAGFELRDCLLWLYGSGFPKGLDISKAIDKAKGAEREVVGRRESGFVPGGNAVYGVFSGDDRITAPATPEAARWAGWNTALKPGYEPIVAARKPLVGSVAANVLEHGTGALNIDACRVGTDVVGWGGGAAGGGTWNQDNCGLAKDGDPRPVKGRWPPNVVLSHQDECEPVGVRTITTEREEPGQVVDEEVVVWRCAPGCPIALLDAQSGESRSPTGPVRQGGVEGYRPGERGDVAREGFGTGYGDAGGASRFFYCAKTSTAERNAGLDGFKRVAASEITGRQEGSPGLVMGGGKANPYAGTSGDGDGGGRQNVHPTVKPINLMRWLCRLVTPPGGLLLDPFVGSGSTGCAAVLEGFNFTGVEREQEYADLAEARIGWWEQHRGKEADEVLAISARSEREAARHRESGQLGLEIP